MLPVGELLNRFPRGLRELSIKYQKPVNLKMNGMEVLVDKGIWEKLYEPLLHLVRNAFAHGIEPPEIRKEQGKPEEGKIEIRAFHRGNQTIIEVSDDGRGLDLEKIVKKAIAKGWLSLQQLATTNKDKLLDFIFEPGFSTASQVNELCGRGVGLDVVRAQIEQLKGKVKVTSVPKQGTTFTLYLPLTLTISKFVVASVESTVVALPSESIKEIFFSKTEHIKTLGTQKFVSWREQLLSIHRLADLLDYYYPIPAQPKTRAFAHSKDTKTIPLLIIRGDQQDFALEIEGFDSEKELVIKPFHESIALPDYIYGCTVLGDGTFSPAIDPVTLLAYAAEQSNKPLNNYTRASLAGSTKTYPGQNSTVSTVLVVDDSVMMRRTLTHTLEKEGYRVLPARDGSEAMELLRQTPQINLIVSDLEMPNINGFEFLGQLRKDSELASIPVVLLTSRSNDKHRQLAIHLGAKAYLTKPYIEQEFLAALKEIMVNSLPAA
jgi:chemotaxis family two-component system sensor histidine kinase/response regulator PixL